MTDNLDFKVSLFSTSYNSKIIQDRTIPYNREPIVTDLSLGAVFNQFEWLITQISRSR